MLTFNINNFKTSLFTGVNKITTIQLLFMYSINYSMLKTRFGSDFTPNVLVVVVVVVVIVVVVVFAVVCCCCYCYVSFCVLSGSFNLCTRISFFTHKPRLDFKVPVLIKKACKKWWL